MKTEKRRFRILVGVGDPANGDYHFLPWFSAGQDQLDAACEFAEWYYQDLIGRVADWKSWWCQVSDADTAEGAASEVGGY